MQEAEATTQTKAKKEHKIKCVIWDLDNTVWDGVLLEDGDNVKLRDGIVDIFKELDNRGILQSIASKNEHNTTWKKLEEFGIAEYFLYPHINWNSKSSSIRNIVTAINIGMDTIAFIDDQPFEREEVAFELPDVLTIDALDLTGLLDRPELNPKFITQDSKLRRKMYMSDIERNKLEEVFTGPQEEFLGSLGMVLKISKVETEDLQRAEELTVRTNQLNTTGYTYSYEELDQLRQSKDHRLLIVELKDKYGTYGKIGLVMIDCSQPGEWTVKLLLMSCRVMSRGVGSIIINHILMLAKENGVRLKAEFVKTDRNRMMYVTYKFAGFKEIEENGDKIMFENDLSMVQSYPEYVTVEIL
jgi:FkbH-like protein